MIVLKHIKMENSKKDGINHRGRLCHIRYCTGYVILGEGTYSEIIVIGINGTDVDNKGLVKDPEQKAYYVFEKNNCLPKHIAGGWQDLRREQCKTILKFILNQEMLQFQFRNKKQADLRPALFFCTFFAIIKKDHNFRCGGNYELFRLR